ncbi:MAG: tyrosine-type recombinase/integrase [Alteromonadaceae bacterium]|nr:tyrosine-type recombinase/integrase [Alteromonadaceae bacterium]
MKIRPPITVMPQVVLADKKRLRDELRTKTNLTGIMTYLKLDNGQYHVLSRYEEDIWLLPDHWFTDATKESGRNLSFNRITTPSLRSTAKVVMSRMIWGDNSLQGKRRGGTLTGSLNRLTSFFNWLPTLNITNTAEITPLVAKQYVEHVKSLKSKRGKRKGKTLVPGTVCQRLLAVERCYTELRDTQYGFAHPWPDSSAVALSGVDFHGKPKTEIISDEVLASLFQYAESILASAPELIRLQLLLEGFKPKSKDERRHGAERSKFLQSHGFASGVRAFNQSIMELRDCCFLMILLTTGMRVHELCNLKRDNWYSEVREVGSERELERFYFIGSTSEKTDEGDTHWLCPQITIDALKVLGDLMLPMQKRLEQQLLDAQSKGDVKEVARLERFSGSVILGRATNKSNQVSVLGSLSVNDRLQKLVDKLGLDCSLASHMFRRTFAVYVVHHKLGDLRYLRDHFKHWSLDMTILYGMNDKQDLELYDDIYAAFDDERQGIIGHWLESDTPLSGGLANQIRNLRDKATPTRTYKSRAVMIEHLSEQIYLRSTGLAWCTNDDGSCAGGRCEECEHGVIDDKKQAFWEGVYAQQIELKQIEGLGESGQTTVDKAIVRCEKVLSDLGADIEIIKQRVNTND